MAKAKKKAATKKAATKKTNDLNVNFAEDIPKISRDGAGNRGSKYNDLLDTVRERAESAPDKPSVAVLTFTKQGEATSRYTSIKSAVDKREDTAHWEVAVRRHGDDDVRLYVKWNDEPQSDNEDK